MNSTKKIHYFYLFLLICFLLTSNVCAQWITNPSDDGGTWKRGYCKGRIQYISTDDCYIGNISYSNYSHPHCIHGSSVKSSKTDEDSGRKCAPKGKISRAAIPNPDGGNCDFYYHICDDNKCSPNYPPNGDYDIYYL